MERHRFATILLCNTQSTEIIVVTETDYTKKLDELDRLLNDPDVKMEPSRVWTLLAEISRYSNTQASAARE
jgi:vacuolar-type H+-ATPase subunit C/Vma6